MNFNKRLLELESRRWCQICDHFADLIDCILTKFEESEDCASVVIAFVEEGDVWFSFFDGMENFFLSKSKYYPEIAEEYNFYDEEECMRFVSDFLYYVYLNTNLEINFDYELAPVLKLPMKKTNLKKDTMDSKKGLLCVFFVILLRIFRQQYQLYN